MKRKSKYLDPKKLAQGQKPSAVKKPISAKPKQENSKTGKQQMIKSVISALALAVLLGATAAHTATIANRDTTAHKVVVMDGEDRKELIVEGAERLTGLCQATCSVYLNDDPDPYDIASEDDLEIVDGALQIREEPSTGSDNQ